MQLFQFYNVVTTPIIKAVGAVTDLRGVVSYKGVGFMLLKWTFSNLVTSDKRGVAYSGCNFSTSVAVDVLISFHHMIMISHTPLTTVHTALHGHTPFSVTAME